MQQTTFDAAGPEQFSAGDLRNLRHRSEWSEFFGSLVARFVQPKVPEHLLTELTQQLHPLLNRYLEPENGRVGNGLAHLMGGVQGPTITEFARDLVRPAATLGSERVVELLLGWINGEPLRYREEALLSGATVDQPLALAEEGIRIARLPTLLEELPDHLPTFIPGIIIDGESHNYNSFLGGVRLSIDCKAEPALYPLSKSETGQRDIQRTWAQGRIPGLSLDRFCEALSLAGNHCIRRRARWTNYGELEEFNTIAGTGVPRVEASPWTATTLSLSEQHLKEARKICRARYPSKEEGPRPRLDIAINRWMKSKGSASLADQLIDLRIALEALYLEGEAGEIRFRLATYGAWHLGTDAAERGEYHKTLRDAYDLSSKAVHAGAVEDIPENQEKLTAAQDLCRQGILKRLFEEPPKPKWNELIMGAV